MLAYSGRNQFALRTIDLAALITEMTPMLQVSISKRADLRFSLAPETPPIEGDPTQIRQIVMNLVINASEAIGDRDGTIDVATGMVMCDPAYLADAVLGDAAREGPCAFIEVTDTGSGMDPETQARIFDPFFTTKFTGRGLGLAAVLGLVRTHGGAIKVRSQVGQGTMVRVLMPPSAQPVQIPSPRTARAEGWRGSGTILLVDDEAAVRTTAQAMLERFGYRVIVAADGRQAVAAFKKRRADVVGVLLDLTMPHMDGQETFRELRAIDPNVRVLLSSGYGEQELERRFAGQTLAGFIQKPYELQSLGDALRAAFGG
jgi:CheY-like chemotaxis protein